MHFKNISNNAKIITNSSIIFIVILFVMSFIFYFIFMDYLNRKINNDLQESLNITISNEFKNLESFIFGFAHWSELSKELKENKKLSEKMLNDWSANNIDKNDLVAIIIDDKIIAEGGIYHKEIKFILTNSIIKNIYQKTSMVKDSHKNHYILNIQDKTILLVASPLCSDDGDPLTEGIMLYAKIIDNYLDNLSILLKGKLSFSKNNNETWYKLNFIDSFDYKNIRNIYIKPNFDINKYVLTTIIIYLIIQVLTLGSIIFAFRFLLNTLNKLYERIESDYQRVQAELKLAANIQKNVLIDIDDIKNNLKDTNLSLKYIPYDFVSGDIYDVVKNDKGEWYIVLDISGHGVSAALVGNFVLSTFREEVNFSESPNQLFEKMSYKISNFLPSDMFVCGICIKINGENATICSAGGEEIIYFNNKNKTINKISLKGALLGISGVMTKDWQEYKINLNKGDKIFLFTDGIINSLNPNNEDNKNKFYKTLKKYIIESSDIITHKLYEEVLSLSNGKINDDITLLCIEKN